MRRCRCRRRRDSRCGHGHQGFTPRAPIRHPGLRGRPAGQHRAQEGRRPTRDHAIPTSVHLVPVDFERDDLIGTLTENGYRTDARTFFVWEGVTQYLTEDAVRTTLAALQGAPAGSRLVFTYVRSDFIDGTNMYGAKVLYKRFRQRQQVWKFGLAARRRSRSSSAHTAGDSSNRRVPTTTSSTTSDRPGAIWPPPIWSGRRTARSANSSAFISPALFFINERGMLSQPLTVEDRRPSGVVDVNVPLWESLQHFLEGQSSLQSRQWRARRRSGRRDQSQVSARLPRILKLSRSSKWRSSRLAEANMSS